jgi:hypothetical protein
LAFWQSTVWLKQSFPIKTQSLQPSLNQNHQRLLLSPQILLKTNPQMLPTMETRSRQTQIASHLPQMAHSQQL